MRLTGPELPVNLLWHFWREWTNIHLPDRRNAPLARGFETYAWLFARGFLQFHDKRFELWPVAKEPSPLRIETILLRAWLDSRCRPAVDLAFLHRSGGAIGSCATRATAACTRHAVASRSDRGRNCLARRSHHIQGQCQVGDGAGRRA